jgi:hypothetical protein
MNCEYCADTKIDGLTLSKMGVELPCRYCETDIQPERIGDTPDSIIGHLTNAKIRDVLVPEDERDA